ncbi:MAG: hypothetical protein QNJ22_15825 [Desulfosarcinaceae bacterium]|nr:hypothetical protein [Desulfosarcinaceae bacterium]
MVRPPVTLAYSTHRPESLPAAEAEMARHDVIFLEEAAQAELTAMLSGELAVEDYLPLMESEYPEFSRRSCHLLRRLHQKGIAIRQCDPYMDRLLQIHDRFAAGGSPSEIPPGTPMEAVYGAEKNATAALLNYYEVARSAPFDAVVEALQRFARSDAARFRLRDRMRAIALIDQMPDNRVYVEAGTMHLWLRRELKRLLADERRVVTRHLQSSAVKALTGRTYLMAPGDRLTAVYLFTPQADDRRCRRLAAQSLIYNKIVTKVEMTASDAELPHLKDEWQAIRRVERLSLSACRRLFSHIRRLPTRRAREAVADLATSG